jgi:hypothetical protein
MVYFPTTTEFAGVSFPHHLKKSRFPKLLWIRKAFGAASSTLTARRTLEVRECLE